MAIRDETLDQLNLEAADRLGEPIDRLAQVAESIGNESDDGEKSTGGKVD